MVAARRHFESGVSIFLNSVVSPPPPPFPTERYDWAKTMHTEHKCNDRCLLNGDPPLYPMTSCETDMEGGCFHIFAPDCILPKKTTLPNFPSNLSIHRKTL